MNETVYVYIVHSDINENNIYAEFRTEAEALEYAKAHEDELTYVDKVEVTLDEDGDILEMFDSETIWVYSEADSDEEFEDDYWDMMAEEEEDRKWAEADLGDTTWFEDLDTDKLVETLEENEDIVECKECFELFSKEACTKIAIGYICPECGKIHSHEEPEFEIDSIPDVVIADEDTFKVDFPELERTEYENDMMPDVPTPEVGPNPEPECVGPECEAPVEAPVTKEETITKLVVDEHEAIDGYEKAKVEIEANSELDKEEKEEILDTIEHIKEEEIEHIEELEELVDEVEETKADEPAEESEILAESTDRKVLVEKGFWGNIILDDYFSKDGERNPRNKNGTGYWVDLIDPDTKESIIKPEDKKTKQKLKDAETIATQLSKAEDGWAIIRVEGAQGWNGILEVYEKGKRTQDITQKKLANLNKAWDDQEAKKKARQELDRSLGKDKKDSENIDLPGNNEKQSKARYTAAALNVTLGKATYVVVKDAELNASVNIKDCTVTADKEGIVEVVQNQKNKRWVVKGVKPGKVTLTIKKGDKEICKCEVAVTAGKLSKEDQEALDRLRSLGYELTAHVAESLEEHVNEEHPAIESEQELVGIDNAVVDCKVNKVITHSEDEKPVDCKGEKKPLKKPLTEKRQDPLNYRDSVWYKHEYGPYIVARVAGIAKDDIQRRELKETDYICPFNVETSVWETVMTVKEFRNLLASKGINVREWNDKVFDKSHIKVIREESLEKPLTEGIFDFFTGGGRSPIKKVKLGSGVTVDVPEELADKFTDPEFFNVTGANNKLDKVRLTGSERISSMKDGSPRIKYSFNTQDVDLMGKIAAKVKQACHDLQKPYDLHFLWNKLVLTQYKPLTESLTESLNKDQLQVMEEYLKATKFASLNTEWEDEGKESNGNFYIDIIGAYLDYSTRTSMFTLGLSIYHASEDNNAEYPERHTDEEEFSYESLAEMYEDEECKEILDRIYEDNLAKLTKSLSEETHAKYAKPEGNRVQAYNNALTYAKKENKPFIYGYTNHTGKFFAAEQPMKVTGTTRDAEKEFRNRYKNCSVVYMVYPDKDFVTEGATKLQEDARYVTDYLGYSIYKDTDGDKPYWCQRGYTDQCWDESFASLSEIKDYIKKHMNDYTDEDEDEEYDESLKESLYNFTPEEQKEYGIDEDGYSLEGFDTYVRCNWCGEVYSEFDCKFEANLGWLCPRCQEEVRSHGGPLTIIENPTEEQIQASIDRGLEE